jgi:hypothetical protein
MDEYTTELRRIGRGTQLRGLVFIAVAMVGIIITTVNFWQIAKLCVLGAWFLAFFGNLYWGVHLTEALKKRHGK